MYARPDPPPTPRPIRRVLVSAGLAIVLLGSMPWPVGAEEPSASPSESPVPTAEPTAAPPAEPTAAPTPEPSPTPTPSPIVVADDDDDPDPTPTAAPTSAPAPILTRLLVYRSSAMVRQYTSYYCVPAAAQTMLNLIKGTSNRSYSTQRYYYQRIRKHNRYWYRTRGNDPQGWAWALRAFSGRNTPYYARSFDNKTQAINAIADAISRTRHPVGITVDRGTHAWVVLGYRAQIDPVTKRRTILGFYVNGPLGSPRDPWRYEYLRMSTFRRRFSMYHEWQRKVIWEGRWVIISE